MCASDNRRASILFGTAFILLLFVTMSEGIFKLTKVECLVLDKSIVNLTLCQLKPIRRDVSAFSLRVQLLKPVKTLTAYAETLRKYNTYKPFLPRVSIDACAFFKQRKRMNYENVLYDIIKEYSNFNRSCPYEGDIIIDRFTPAHKDLQLPLFTGDYLFKSSYVASGVTSFSLNFWVTYRELEKWQKV